MEKVKLILDTDIGCDCDDAGAMAVMHRLADLGLCEILAVTHCTSRLNGVQCIDAINRFYGRGEIPVGICGKLEFLNGPGYDSFAGEVGRGFPNRFQAGGRVMDAVKLLRQTLAGQPDHSVTLVAIGPLINLGGLLDSGPDDFSPLSGRDLAAQKLRLTVIMGGCFDQTVMDGPEWNIAQDVPAAQKVSEQWPVPLVYAPFEAGAVIKTGARLLAERDNRNPVRLSYALYNDAPRESWDLLAVLFAVCGEDGLFTLSPAGTVVFAENGVSKLVPGKDRDRYLMLTEQTEKITSRLEQLMLDQEK